MHFTFTRIAVASTNSCPYQYWALMILATLPQLLASYALCIPRRRVLSYRLPSDLQSPATPLSSTSDSPDRVRKGFSPPSEAPCWAHQKNPERVSPLRPCSPPTKCLRADSKMSYELQSRCNQKVMAAFVAIPKLSLFSKFEAPSFHACPGRKTPI